MVKIIASCTAKSYARHSGDYSGNTCNMYNYKDKLACYSVMVTIFGKYQKQTIFGKLWLLFLLSITTCLRLR